MASDGREMTIMENYSNELKLLVELDERHDELLRDLEELETWRRTPDFSTAGSSRSQFFPCFPAFFEQIGSHLISYFGPLVGFGDPRIIDFVTGGTHSLLRAETPVSKVFGGEMSSL